MIPAILPIVLICLGYVCFELVISTRARAVRKGAKRRFLRVGNGLVAMLNVSSCRMQHHPADSSTRFRQNTALF